MLERAIKEFNKYAANYDLEIPSVDLKYNHTFRVVEYAKKILESLDVSEHMLSIGCIAALLHDIARFEQFTKYGTYKDSISFDHGLRGAQILLENDYINNYVQNDDDKRVIVNAILKHNKRDLELTGDDFVDTIAKVVRDADKLDIMVIVGNDIKDPNYQINKKMFEDIINSRSCDYKNVICSDDQVLGIIGFVFDVNYQKSFEIIRESNVIDLKINLLRKYCDAVKIDLLEQSVNEFIEKKIGDEKYVRNKV